MKILAISGSLRKDSYNTRLLELARTLLADKCDMHIYLCGELPFYNQDADGSEKPEKVSELLELISNADGLLFATPEYNYSVPGVLKNAIDWASRPAFRSVLKNRPTGILSASMSGFGGLRAQMHLKQILGGTLTPVYPAPDFVIPLAHEAFSADRNETDPALANRLSNYLNGFLEWLEKQI